MPPCYVCEEYRPEKFRPRNQSVCIPCLNRQGSEYKKHRYDTDEEYRKKNIAKASERGRISRRQNREIVLALYGWVCRCCGESTREFLALDHVNNGGNQERKVMGQRELYKKLAKAGIADPAYQILCHNCNCARGYYGYCPHQLIEIKGA